ncbi:hypothetical protein C1Y63_02425 [Corynebacterium sp. 13CS0277]|uniref:hypothetical protein n=1 Tax=Corynebacterium sp. 13CS0277 TaxID=2071994 RepID=UPI000D039E00|nr:hypothetical protein [Corynebacterium sp. 13CS0277]PRQ12185.1 hypothetical protein C1Y63_02425 [Corynebacterium sp. 13CS0277]
MRFLSLATAIAGIAGFVVIIVAAWALTPAETAEFSAYWGLFFTGTGVLTGFMQETTRSLAGTPTPGGARPLKVATWVGVAIAAAICVTSPAWIGSIVSTHHIPGVLLLAVGLASYSIQAAIAGILSARKLWSRYALLVACDSGVRMIAAIAAWLAGYHLLAFMIITVMGAASWLLLLRPRGTIGNAVADCSPRVFARRAWTAMGAAGATAVLIVGFPTIVKLTNPTAAGAAAVIYAVTLTRAPLLVPLQQFQSALIVRFVEHRDRLGRALTTPLLIVWAVGVVGAAAAWVVGPWLMTTILRSEAYHMPGWALGAYTIGAACTATMMVVGTATIATERHAYYLSGWIVATALAIAAQLLPWSLQVTTVLALTAGPLVGTTIQGIGLARIRPHEDFAGHRRRRVHWR